MILSITTTADFLPLSKSITKILSTTTTADFLFLSKSNKTKTEPFTQQIENI